MKYRSWKARAQRFAPGATASYARIALIWSSIRLQARDLPILRCSPQLGPRNRYRDPWSESDAFRQFSPFRFIPEVVFKPALQVLEITEAQKTAARRLRG